MYFYGTPSQTGFQSAISMDTDKIAYSKHSVKYDKTFCSDIDSNFTSISQIKTAKKEKHFLEGQINEFPVQFDEAMTSESDLSKSNKSDGSFLVPRKLDGKSAFRSPQQDYLSKSAPLRLFNRRGKPLTDRTGRSLANIFGEPLVVFDDNGRLVSDSRGNQIFNCFGESAIHSNTDLHVFPLVEPGIPVMDFHKKHILFLFDSKGHPMTDSLGRPLLTASGKRMFGIDAKDIINASDYKDNKLKNMYGKAPLENSVRKIQIFNADLMPLTDVNGDPLYERQIICNKDGMPMCDDMGRLLYFNYGAKFFTQKTNLSPTHCSKGYAVSSEEVPSQLELNSPQHSTSVNPSEIQSVTEANIINRIECKTKEPCNHPKSFTEKISENSSVSGNLHKADINHTISNIDSHYKTSIINRSDCKTMNRSNEDKSEKSVDINLLHKNYVQGKTATNNTDYLTKGIKPEQLETGAIYNSANITCSNEAIIIFDATKKFEKQQASSTKVGLTKYSRKNINGFNKRDSTKRICTSNVIECIRNSINLPKLLKTTVQTPLYNNYGKPTRDRYGAALYDKFGIPLTGAHGIRLSEKARHALRVKLRNSCTSPKTQTDTIGFNGNHHNFGEPYYDKYGRPLYDLFGRLMYDVYGRPLTDAFGRPLVDAIGQPLMDSKGNVLTSASSTRSDFTLTDVFGRPLHDEYGRSLFDAYGRPRFDIYTNAIYDNCGRPARDGNDAVLFDFLNKPIQPTPPKPLYRNARTLLPRYIDKILEVPSMYRVFKFSHTALYDLFGGPLFDDFGRPLYNKKGKPLYDKYGRPLYSKDGRPLCDCYGRPLSEEIRESPNDQTSSVVDSIKFLKLTKESSQWMESRRSEINGFRSSIQKINDDTVGIKVLKPSKHKSTQYIYALTRITYFSCGRKALEILEAPLSSSTASQMHRLPIDNKPLIMMAKRRRRIVKRGRK